MAEQPNPFLDLYTVLKKHAIDILNKNKRFGATAGGEGLLICRLPTWMLSSLIYLQPWPRKPKSWKKIYSSLRQSSAFRLLLGLLGTVWGILTTFSELQAQSGGGTQQMV